MGVIAKDNLDFSRGEFGKKVGCDGDGGCFAH